MKYDQKPVLLLEINEIEWLSFPCVRVVLALSYMTYDLQIRQSADFIIVVNLLQFTLCFL